MLDASAIGAFTRIDGWEDTGTIVSSQAGDANAFDPGYVLPHIVSRVGDILLRSVSVDHAAVQDASADGVAQMVASTNTPVGAMQFVPSVTTAAAHIGLASADNEFAGASTFSYFEGGMQANYIFEDADDGLEPQWLHISLQAAAFGAHSSSGSGYNLQQVPSSVSAFVLVNGELAASILGVGIYNDNEVTWTVYVDKPGDDLPPTEHVGGMNVFEYVVIPIENFDRVTLTGFHYQQWDAVAGPWAGEASHNFTSTANAWVFVSGSGAPIPDGDVDMDGDVDEDDLDVIVAGYPKPAIGGWVPTELLSPGATLTNGDADHDGDVDRDDFAAWLDNAPSNILFVSNDSDVDDGIYSFEELSLREALDVASNGDRIIFAPWVNDIELSGLSLPIAADVFIVGPGADKLTIDGNNLSRLFGIGAGVNVTMSGLTLTGGLSTGGGGAIYNNGNLTLLSVDVIGNQTDTYGGGVFVSTTGTLVVDGSNFEDNHAVGTSSNAGHGAIGGTFKAGLSLKISNSTFLNNSASSVLGASAGGAVGLYGLDPTTSFEIVNSTFSGNSAGGGGALQLQSASGMTGSIINSTIAYNTGTNLPGGGIYNVNASVVMHNAILAANTSSNATYHDAGGASLSGGGVSSHNIIGQIGNSGLADGVSGNKVGTLTVFKDPLLAPLGYYGGRTKTHALLAGSIALDAGKGSLTDLYDQRGYDREFDLPTSNGIDGYRDIGAYEAGEGTTLIVRSDGDRNNSIALQATTDSLRLREALALSAALAGTEIISFDQSSWGDETIGLSNAFGTLEIDSDVTIQGPGVDHLTIEATDEFTVLAILDATVTLRDLTIANGWATSYSAGGIHAENSDVTLERVAVIDNVGYMTGGIFVDGGSLSLIASTVDGNTADITGGVAVANADLLIRSSTISGNTGMNAYGGVVFGGAGNLLVVNTTISGNVGYEVGGIFVGGTGTNLIVNSTITDNVTYDNSGHSAPFMPGGLRVGGTANLELHNTIVAGNRLLDDVASDFLVDSLASITSNSSYNFIGYDPDDYFDAITGLGNIRGILTPSDARLAPLAYNGGPTKTHVPYYDSEVIDAGDDAIAALWSDYDQRGMDREKDSDYGFGDGVDIGAVELAISEYYS